MYGLTKAVRACTTGKRKLKRPPHLALSPGGGPPKERRNQELGRAELELCAPPRRKSNGSTGYVAFFFLANCVREKRFWSR